MTEEEYNKQLAQYCKQEKIEVVGIADHGSVKNIEALTNTLTSQDIFVFPGFEITSSEKSHFVCIFSEDTNIDELNGYLGGLGLAGVDKKTSPSKLSAEQIINKVIDEYKGIIYAAHCTDDNGILNQKNHHIWKNEKLLACQIPGSLDELKEREKGNFYYKVITNKESEYQRKRPMVIINAKDVEKPETLTDPKASCLIKMTTPSFDAFRKAFYDSDNIKLNSDYKNKKYSYIESVRITGGYLGGLSIDFSEHLNTTIGGRGVGKSTLLECIRYAFNISPTGEDSRRNHDKIISHNLCDGTIELTIYSSHFAKSYRIQRTFQKNAIVKTEDDQPLDIIPKDILPNLEIYGQNEIYEIASDPTKVMQIINRFLKKEKQQEYQRKLKEINTKLQQNRESKVEVYNNFLDTQDKANKLPSLQEQENRFKALGLDEKLKIIPLLEQEEQVAKVSCTEITRTLQAIEELDIFPNETHLDETSLTKLPHKQDLYNIQTAFLSLKQKNQPKIKEIIQSFKDTQQAIDKHTQTLENNIKQSNKELQKIISTIPASEGKSGKQIVQEYQDLQKNIVSCQAASDLGNQWKKAFATLEKERKDLLISYEEIRNQKEESIKDSFKKLNKKLEPKLKITLNVQNNRKPLIDLLLSFNLENVKEGRLGWIKNTDELTPLLLVKKIREWKKQVKETSQYIPKWDIPQIAVEALLSLNINQIMQIEEVVLENDVLLELNVEPNTESLSHYKSIDNLSTGQKCTAILHLLLLDNTDPLLIDQPEDNLDNAFIANLIVKELRKTKFERQFLFATHNANIPVFGNAEWIGVCEVEDRKGIIQTQGGIDLEKIQEDSSRILEGGEAAFIQRKEKYGY